ncbi:MAG: hypothetical protein HY934_05670 [Candidatus Firestonebacteria bacterium]|nr:hypothetical protein [Candidatus Firestonebacteria bacterium]
MFGNTIDINPGTVKYEPGPDTNHSIYITVPAPSPGNLIVDETEAIAGNQATGSSWEQVTERSKIKILNNGFAEEAIKFMTEKLKLEVGILEVNAGYKELEDIKILIIPTGGLYGIEENYQLKDILKEYVKAGGNIICFTQPFGENYKILSVPEGDGINCAGYIQDESCWDRSVHIGEYHPVVAGMDKTELTIAIDGYIQDWPKMSKQVFIRNKNWMPGYIIYNIDTTSISHNGGYVVVTNAYSDYGNSHGQLGDDNKIIRDTINWMMNPDMMADVIIQKAEVETQNFASVQADTTQIQIYEPKQITLGPITIKNTSLDTTYYARVWVNTPDRKSVSVSVNSVSMENGIFPLTIAPKEET